MARRDDSDLHARAAEARRRLEQASGESYNDVYRRRWAEQRAIPDDELI